MNHLPNKHETKIQYAILLCGGVFCCLLAAYGYLVSATVVHVVIEQEVKREMSELTSVISELESAYITRQHAINSEIALQQGFEVTTNKIFIPKQPSSLVLSADLGGL
jgi:hypothetical protein